MTRINLVHPETLTVNHLIAEYRELPRVVALVQQAQAKGLTPSDFAARTPVSFTLGTGHMLFFYTRLGWLERRYQLLVYQMQKRGYNVQYPSLANKLAGLDPHWFGDWTPSVSEIAISQARIDERLQSRMTYKNKVAPKTGATGYFKGRT